MLTMDEIVGVQAVQFRQRLEDLDEAALRRLLLKEDELRRLTPPSVSRDDARSAVSDVLADRVRRTGKATAAEAQDVVAAPSPFFGWMHALFGLRTGR